MSVCRRFVFWVLVGLAAATALNLLPYWLSRHAPGYDGFQLMGFPFSFYGRGGFAYHEEFSIGFLLVDIAFAVAGTLLFAWLVVRFSRGRHSSGRGFLVVDPTDPTTTEKQ